ncbi:MAG TPA: hypothetical protein VMI10_18900 [Terriglobales bacterium]|nr:hypothetical protein [Terriglobales bacterium]
MFRINGLGKSSLKSGAASWLAALIVTLCALPACSINVDKKGEKDGSKRVDIQSPIGDLHVSAAADIHDAGLSVYPGAKPAPKDDSSDEKSANVNLDLPGFKLKVVAAEFLSDDGPDRIKAYYDKELGKYGKPLECRGAYTSGGRINGHKDDDLQKPVTCDTSSGDGVELKVGTEGNQHIVAVKPNGKGTRFALVYVRMHTGKDDTI